MIAAMTAAKAINIPAPIFNEKNCRFITIGLVLYNNQGESGREAQQV
jgi:hypothetical protein